MKNSKIAKLLAISLSLLLLVGVAVMISATAEDATEAPTVYTNKVGIASINLSYKAQTEMAFAVYDDYEVAEGSKKDVYLLFFNSDPGDKSGEELYKKAMARKSSSGTVKIGGVDHLLFYSDGIKASDLAEDLFVCPVVVETVVDGDNYTYNYARGYAMKNTDGEYSYVRACSPVSYARQKILDAVFSGVDLKPEDSLLYSNIISYAIAALKKQGEELVFSEATLIVNGGVVGNTTDGTIKSQTLNVKKYPAGSTITLRAEARNDDGEYFLRWEDIDGKTVSTDRVYCDAPVHNNLGYVIYTAVYGSSAESPYAGVVDFEDLTVQDAAGNYVAPAGNPMIAPDFVEGKTNNSNSVTFYVNKNTAAMVLTNRCHYEPDDSAESGYKVNGETLVSLEDATNPGKDKNLTITTTSTLGSFTQAINNYTKDGADAVEFDFRINSFTTEGDFVKFVIPAASSLYQFTVHVGIYGNETDGYTLKVGAFTTNNEIWYNETNNPTSAPVVDASNVKGYKFNSLDEIFCVKVRVDDSGSYPVAYVSVNGQQMFCGAGTTLNGKSKGYFNSVSTKYASGATGISKMNTLYYSNVKGSLTLDNVTFMDK